MKLKRSSIFTRIVIIAVIAYAVVMLANAWKTNETARAEQLQLAQEAEQLRWENQRLRYEIEHAEDPEIIGQIARERLGLVTPGERVLYDVGN